MILTTNDMIEISELQIETDICSHVDARKNFKKSVWHIFKMHNYTWVFRTIINREYYEYHFLDEALACFNTDGVDNRGVQAKSIDDWE